MPDLRAPGPAHRSRSAGVDGAEEGGGLLLTPQASTIDPPLEDYLQAAATREPLRVLACGSVDDGKSTLLGRLLFESGGVLDDQLASLATDSKLAGTRGGALDFALLFDGLSAEREQGITIDVAHRYFGTPRRSFIVADAPGHEQYTRNMVTGASGADVAIVLVDARKGLLTQTRRHTYIATLLGISRVVFAVNKMDLMGYASDVFGRIAGEVREFAAPLGLEEVISIPMAAAHGDNVTARSPAMPWYAGPSLLEWLENTPLPRGSIQAPLRLPVQHAVRPDADFRGAAGLIASGTVQIGNPVVVFPSNRQTTIARILVGDRDVPAAIAGESVTVTFDDDVDVGRGDVIAAAADPPEVADQLQAIVIGLSEQPLLPGRSYLMKIGTQTVPATPAPLKHRIDVNTLERLASRQLALNEIGVCDITLARPVVFEPYATNRDMGGFLLIDRVTGDTVGAGLVQFALRRSHNVVWQQLHVDKAARAALTGHRACVVWLTGLSGAGKSTIADLVEKRLHARGCHTYLLDGDNVRHGLNKNLGFTPADRVENVRRLAEVARLMADAGLIVLVSAISPFRAERRMARELMAPGDFLEVFVDAPLELVEARDPKGLYRKARRGQLCNFTAIDSPYEVPEAPDLRIDTATVSAAAGAEMILERLRAEGVVR